MFHNINSDIMTFQEIDITNDISMYQKLYQYLKLIKKKATSIESGRKSKIKQLN